MTCEQVTEHHAWARLVRKMDVLVELPADGMHAHNWRQVVDEAREDWARAYQKCVATLRKSAETQT